MSDFFFILEHSMIIDADEEFCIQQRSFWGAKHFILNSKQTKTPNFNNSISNRWKDEGEFIQL